MKKKVFNPNREELKKFMDEFLIKAGNNVKKFPSEQKPYETDPSPSKELSNEDTKSISESFHSIHIGSSKII